MGAMNSAGSTPVPGSSNAGLNGGLLQNQNSVQAQAQASALGVNLPNPNNPNNSTLQNSSLIVKIGKNNTILARENSTKMRTEALYNNPNYQNKLPRSVSLMKVLNHNEVVCAVTVNVKSKHVLTGGKGVVKIWNIANEIDRDNQMNQEENEMNDRDDNDRDRDRDRRRDDRDRRDRRKGDGGSRDIEKWIEESKVDDKCADYLRSQSHKIQQAVIDMGECANCRNPSAIVMARIRKAGGGASKGEGRGDDRNGRSRGRGRSRGGRDRSRSRDRRRDRSSS